MGVDVILGFLIDLPSFRVGVFGADHLYDLHPGGGRLYFVCDVLPYLYQILAPPDFVGREHDLLGIMRFQEIPGQGVLLLGSAAFGRLSPERAVFRLVEVVFVVLVRFSFLPEDLLVPLDELEIRLFELPDFVREL